MSHVRVVRADSSVKEFGADFVEGLLEEYLFDELVPDLLIDLFMDNVRLCMIQVLPTLC